MSQCEDIKEKFADIKVDVANITELLQQYRQTGNDSVAEKMREKLDGIDIDELQTTLQTALNDLIEQYSHSNIFQGNVVVANGLVTFVGDVEAPTKESISYLPRFINTIDGDLNLAAITPMEMNFPDRITGNLILSSVDSTTGVDLNLALPKRVGGYIDLSGLKSVKELVLSEFVGGNINMKNLESAKSIIFPEFVGGSINLAELRSANDLIFPGKVNKYLYLSSLRNVDVLKLPEVEDGAIQLGPLRSVGKAIFPKSFDQNLLLSNLRSIEDVQLPDVINGYLDLRRLESAKHLNLPDKIEGYLNLKGLVSTEHLDLSNTDIKGDIYLDNLSEHERQKLKEKYPRYASQIKAS